MRRVKICQFAPTLSVDPPSRRKRKPVSPEEGAVVTVLLERSINGNQVSKIAGLLRELSLLATQQPGYVAGQTLSGENEADYSLVTNTWETWKSLEHWQAWSNKPERQQLEAEVAGLLGSPTRVQVFS